MDSRRYAKRIGMRAYLALACLLLTLSLIGCGDPESAEVEAGATGETSQAGSEDPQSTSVSASRDASACSWHIAYEGARSGDHAGSYVIHMYDGRGALRLTRQIAFQEEGILGLTISFGGEALSPGWTGTREMGTSDDDGRLALHLGEEFPWENEMTGERRPFTVHITRNDAQTIEGSFEGSLLNVPRRPEVNLGDIDVEGEFVWKAGECRRES
jgi:hypothetical protein